MFRTRLCRVLAVGCAALLIATPPAAAQDKITLRAGAPQTGEITAYDPAGGTVTLKTERGTIPYPMAQVAKIELGERPEVAKGLAAAAAEKHAEAVDLLKPLVDRFLGIDSPWVPMAAGVLADSLAKTGKTFDSEQVADKILKAYPNSVFRFQGMIAKASGLMARQQNDQALALLAEVEKALPSTAAPDERTAAIFSDLHFNKGVILKAKGDKQKALESFLTVVALYPTPAKRAAQAMAEAEALKKEDPKLVVN